MEMENTLFIDLLVIFLFEPHFREDFQLPRLIAEKNTLNLCQQNVNIFWAPHAMAVLGGS